MKKLLATLACALLVITAGAQEEKHPFYIPVDFGASFASYDGISGAFYMRAAVEYRFNYLKGAFILAELDTRTHPYKDALMTTANVTAGDAAFTDILIGPGWRFMLSDSFKIAVALQGGASNMAYKEVKPNAGTKSEADYTLIGHDYWAPAAKASVMFEYYLNPVFDLFVGAGLPATLVPYFASSADPLVLFPTISAGFTLALF